MNPVLDIATEAARQTMANLRAKLDARAIEVLQSGRDWAEGPTSFVGDDYPSEPRGLSEPVEYAVEVKAGPVSSDWVPPEGWRVIRHADWVAAGRPGLK
jgi:hypothetical protein